MTESTHALIIRVGVDIARLVIQVHAINAAGHNMVWRSLKREQFMAWLRAAAAGLCGGDTGVQWCE